MLKRKLNDGTVVGLSLGEVPGGVLPLDNQDAKPDVPKHHMSFMLNPVEVADLIDGMERQFVFVRTYRSAHGRKLTYVKNGGYIRIEEGDEWIQFPLREHEVRFIRKALESMAESLLFVGTWSGEPEEL
jgi:hypothetical protein